LAAADVFADTAGWAAFFVRRDRQHAAAVRTIDACRAAGQRFVTTNAVLLELVALMSYRSHVPRSQQILVIESMRSSDWVEVVRVDEQLETEAWSMFATHDDKLWSAVDCMSFALMRQRGLGDAFTSDRHFEQAGFRKLLG